MLKLQNETYEMAIRARNWFEISLLDLKRIRIETEGPWTEQNFIQTGLKRNWNGLKSPPGKLMLPHYLHFYVIVNQHSIYFTLQLVNYIIS